MTVKEKLSINATLKNTIIQILSDNVVHTTKDIREQMEYVYGLVLGADYNNTHFSSAMHALKTERRLSAVGYGKYILGQEEQKDDFYDQSSRVQDEVGEESLNVEDISEQCENLPKHCSMNLIEETRRTLISVIESHCQTCVDLLSVINQYDYLQASEKDLEHVGAMLRYKKGLENQLRELKKGL